MNMIAFALFGLVIGGLARFLMPGRDALGFVVTAALGMIGSMLGAFLGRASGLYAPESESAGWVMSLIGALVLLGGYRLIMGRNASA